MNDDMLGERMSDDIGDSQARKLTHSEKEKQQFLEIPHHPERKGKDCDTPHTPQMAWPGNLFCMAPLFPPVHGCATKSDSQSSSATQRSGSEGRKD